MFEDFSQELKNIISFVTAQIFSSDLKIKQLTHTYRREQVFYMKPTNTCFFSSVLEQFLIPSNTLSCFFKNSFVDFLIFSNFSTQFLELTYLFNTSY